MSYSDPIFGVGDIVHLDSAARPSDIDEVWGRNRHLVVIRVEPHHRGQQLVTVTPEEGRFAPNRREGTFYSPELRMVLQRTTRRHGESRDAFERRDSREYHRAKKEAQVRSKYEGSSGSRKYLVQFVHKIAGQRDADNREVSIRDGAFSDSRTLAKELRKLRILSSGESIQEMRVEGDRVIVFPGNSPGSWHSISLTTLTHEPTDLSAADQAQLRSWGKRKIVQGNPPSWVKNEAAWEEAKAAVHKKWRDYDEPWAVVAHVYKQIIGEI
jgi:hypothetical protein